MVRAELEPSNAGLRVGHATSYLSYYYDLLFLAGGHFDATKEKRPLDTKKVSAFVYSTHERIMCKKFCRLSLSKKFLFFYLYVGELGREQEVRMSNLVHLAIADKSQVFSVEMVDCRRS